MRPLLHPDLDEIPVEAILHALADPVRVAIYSRIVASDCAQNCTAFAHVDDKNIPKSTLSAHFKVLREAGLIRSVRRGVEMHNVSRCDELERRFPGLVAAIIAAHSSEAQRRSRGTRAAKSAAAKRKTPAKRAKRSPASAGP